ncbi:MAG: Non-specific serine/threonine protein kinase [Acidobacteriota bacterium]|nr:Non-specific serine/threonine protein kinase [Acidobacteriota bacterium]
MSLVGTTIGHLRFERLLGMGGMGEVYRAFDEKLQRVVAVKTIRAEHRLSGTARARFLREARILSRLANPLICQVYDLIESDEADLLVLEFVDGETLDQLRSDRKLAEREVLEVGARIAEALTVAHREHIIHRDLKPANIMVLASGAVKVLDFGIARSSADDGAGFEPREGGGAPPEHTAPPLAAGHDPESTIALAGRDESSSSFSAALTQQGSIVGTILYMSPEQASGEELTEASDIFSFGILLQELLTGRSPYPLEPIPQLLMRVAENGSLPIQATDGIDPDVARLVEDLKHPIPARRPTAGDCLDRMRFLLDKPQRLRRRRLKVAAISISFALLTIVLAVVSFLAVREKRARNRAESLAVDLEREAMRANREAKTANRVVEFLVDLFEQADPKKSQGREVSVREIVDLGSQRITRQLADEPLIQARLQDTLGAITWRLGDLAAAASLLEQALATEERERGPDEPAVAEVLSHLGAVYIDLGRLEEAGRFLSRAETILARQPTPPVADLARTLNLLGALAYKQGDLKAAEARYSRSLELLRGEAQPPPREVALALNNLAILAWRRADFTTAEARYREALVVNEELLGANHPHLAAQLNNMGILARDLGNFAESERLHRRALAIAEKALGPAHPDVAAILSSLARLYGRQGRVEEGIALLERALAICRATYGGKHAETATTMLRLGDFERQARRWAGAERLILGGKTALAAALGPGHGRLVEAWTALGRLRRDQGRNSDATAAFREGVRIGSATLGASHPDVVALEQELATRR